MRLTKAEADLLLPVGVTEYAGTKEDLITDITNTYWVLDDAPYPYWERQKQMTVLENLADKIGFVIDT